MSETDLETSLDTSYGSCESDFFQDKSNISKPNPKRKKTDHFLHKLYCRESGLSQLKPTFPTPPARLKFPLHKTLPTATLHSHIFLGISSCGQLLITYTYTTDFDDRPISFNTIFKYRLHWWAFVPYAEARKVAEVTLFGNYNVYSPLYLAYCQWPRDSSKIVVFGRSNESFNGLVTQNIRSYVTVTAVPSLQNCQECQKVAASFEEEDIAASWDSCARLNCLMHGLTVHTSFDMAPPYPNFVATTSMKSTGRVVLNSGNFLHVLRVGLENVFETKSTKKSSDSCNMQSEQFIFRSRSLASSNLNVRFSEYQNQTLIGLDPTSLTGTATLDHASDSHSIVDELNIISQGYIGLSSTQNICSRTDSLTLETDSDASSQRSAIMSPPLRRRAHTNMPQRSQQGRLSSKADAGKAYDFNAQREDERICESLSSFRKRCLADKKYEFSEEDTEDCENIVPFRLSRHSEVSILPSSAYPLPPSPLTFTTKDRNSSRSSSSLGDPSDGPSTLRWKSFAKIGSGHGETSDTNSSGSIFIDPNVEPDKVVLRPHNRNHPLLSPREQEIPREITKKPCQSHAEVSNLSSSAHSLPPALLALISTDARSRCSLVDPSDGSSTLRWKSFAQIGSGHGETSDSNSSGSIFLDPNVEPDKVVLRPHNRNHPLLSPREQDMPRESNKKHLSFADNANLSLTQPLLSPPQPRLGPDKGESSHLDNTSGEPSGVDSARSMFPTKSINSFKHSDTSKNVCTSVEPSAVDSARSMFSTKSTSSTKHTDTSKSVDTVKLMDASKRVNSSEAEFSWSKGGCTVQFERRFIEVDDELVSVITDIEDDDESGGTGFHSALPLEVHGTGYVQMQMISNSKAEKLMAPCALVHQMSFDIEQFCHEVAEVLCEKAGMKFWYCNNYDVEIVDVCPQSADVICLAYMKIKATLKLKGAPKSKRLTNDRQQYQTSCLFVWNMNTSMYRVERAGDLDRLETNSQDEAELSDLRDIQFAASSPEQSDDWNPARKEAQQLRENGVLHCWGANQPPVKVMTNVSVLEGTSLQEIKHNETGISFVL
ncbi:uncharacterized protein LOC117654554 [Thrips palmi]|uniref:Uncharacterized protein LOC117654554 n=1 Tax=Thrips palmi TaxID=161013 RepID=A0A6P9AID5_THRPL|nr:uncharacterized protein LOC117654554 [Thrips palmi]